MWDVFWGMIRRGLYSTCIRRVFPWPITSVERHRYSTLHLWLREGASPDRQESWLSVAVVMAQ